MSLIFSILVFYLEKKFRKEVYIKKKISPSLKEKNFKNYGKFLLNEITSLKKALRKIIGVTFKNTINSSYADKRGASGHKKAKH